jgi:hypothetical protein
MICRPVSYAAFFDGPSPFHLAATTAVLLAAENRSLAANVWCDRSVLHKRKEV